MIGTDSPRFQPNTNARLVMCIPAGTRREAIRAIANAREPINREMDRLMRTNAARFI